VFVYQPRNLVIVYTVFCVLNFALSLYGFFCLYQNGFPHESNFVSFGGATRNPDLDQVFSSTENEKKIMLRFGEIENGGMKTIEFGREENVGEIQRGVEYPR
jgi:hypothetical protein